MAEFTTVFRDAEGYYEEKKSKFIANVFRVKTEEDVEQRLTEIRKKHYQARHHCYAYVLGERRDKVKCSDDGEPQKTAGVPILAVLNGQEVTDTLIIVTRYFGGTLLGTGGLVRAYTKAAQDGLLNAAVFTKKQAELFSLVLSYEDYNKVERYLAECEIKPTEITYLDRVTVKIPVVEKDTESFKTKITNFTQNRAILASEGFIHYAVIDGRTELFTKEEGEG